MIEYQNTCDNPSSTEEVRESCKEKLRVAKAHIKALNTSIKKEQQKKLNEETKSSYYTKGNHDYWKTIDRLTRTKELSLPSVILDSSGNEISRLQSKLRAWRNRFLLEPIPPKLSLDQKVTQGKWEQSITQ